PPSVPKPPSASPFSAPPSVPTPVASVSAPKPLPAVSAPAAVPVIPSASSAAPTPVASGDIKIIHFKPPIVVRDLATQLGLKPFKLISELMEMNIFASMNQTLEEAVAQKIAEKHGFLLEIKHRADAAAQQAAKEKEKEKKKPEEDETKNLAPRPPV